MHPAGLVRPKHPERGGGGNSGARGVSEEHICPIRTRPGVSPGSLAWRWLTLQPPDFEECEWTNASSDTKSSTKNIHDLSDKIYTRARALKYALYHAAHTCACSCMQLTCASVRHRLRVSGLRHEMRISTCTWPRVLKSEF